MYAIDPDRETWNNGRYPHLTNFVIVSAPRTNFALDTTSITMQPEHHLAQSLDLT